MPIILRRRAIGALLIIGAACKASDASSPDLSNGQPGVPAPTSPKQDPPVEGARTFVFAHELANPVSGSTWATRYVLYTDGTFAFQYGGPGEQLRGRYTESNSVIVFDWDAWSSAGPWGATGTLDGDIMTVRYNIVMVLTDFEDGVYRLIK
jgi:hypothetical protein